MRRSLAVALLAAALGPAMFLSAREAKTLGEPRKDAALVYIYRKSAAAGGGRALQVFCDDKLEAVLRNNTYTFAYVAPGTHLYWDGVRTRALVDVAAGQTYYLLFHVVDGMKILSAAEGKAAIEKASRYIELTDEEQSKAAGKIAKNWPKYKEEQGSKLAQGAAETPAYSKPASTEGMVQIAAGTPVAVELMENLNSGHVEPGAVVWVRTAKDIEVGGNLFVRAGTPIKAIVRGVQEKGHWSKGGKLDITMVSVTAADGTVCPLIGQIAQTGAKASAVAPTIAAAGSLGAAIAIGGLMKGHQAFYPAGETTEVFTSQEMWVKPVGPAAGDSADVGKVPVSIKAYPRAKIICNLAKGDVPQFVDVVFDGVKQVDRVELLRVAGWTVPDPVRPGRVSSADEGVVAQYEGWGPGAVPAPQRLGSSAHFPSDHRGRRSASGARRIHHRC